MDNIEMLDDREILLELLEEKRQRDSQKAIKKYILIGILVFIVISLIITIPKIIDMYNKYNQAMKYFDTIYNEAQSMMKKIEKLDFKQIEESLSGINNIVNVLNGLLGGGF